LAVLFVHLVKFKKPGQAVSFLYGVSKMRPELVELNKSYAVVKIPKGFKISRHHVCDSDTLHTVKRFVGNGTDNAKMAKSDKLQDTYRTFQTSFAPSLSSGFQMCANASDGCINACLDGTGNGLVFPMIHYARIARTVCLFEAREWTLNKLDNELTNKTKQGKREGFTVAYRGNTFSDYPIESTGLVDAHGAVQFYDYTAIPKRAGLLRLNYWTTFSRKENNDSDCLNVLRSGGNVAVVFASRKGKKQTQLPTHWNRFKVIDGDNTDLRFLDKRGCVVGLKLKAATNNDYQNAIDSGFAVVTD